jgi:hypothetical protein
MTNNAIHTEIESMPIAHLLSVLITKTKEISKPSEAISRAR